MADRIEEFRRFVEQLPDQPFPRYALALEYKGAGRLEESRREFMDLMARHPAYVPAYLQAGFVLQQLGLVEEAKEVFERGIEAARRAGDGHAVSELTASLQAMSS